MYSVYLYLILSSVYWVTETSMVNKNDLDPLGQVNTPARLQTAAVSTNDAALRSSSVLGINTLPVGPKRLIVRFTDRTEPVPFDIIGKSNLGLNDISNQSIIVTILKHLKTYIIELGTAYSEDDMKSLTEFLKKEGGEVETDAIAFMIPLEKKLDDSAETTKDDDPPSDANKQSVKDDGLKPPWNLWYAKALNIQEGWKVIERDGSNSVKVCLIDTGADYNHAALRDKVEKNKLEENGVPNEDDDDNGVVDDIYGANFIDENGDPMDTHGNGTSMAGIIAAKGDKSETWHGINPNASLILCKAFNHALEGRVSDILKCINYCISREADIQNHNWSLNVVSNALKAAFAEAEIKDIMMVVSVGQSTNAISKLRNIDKRLVIPAMFSRYFSNVLTVSGMQKLNNKSIENREAMCLKRPNVAYFCDHSKYPLYEIYSNSFFGPIHNQIVAPARDINTIDIKNRNVLVTGVSIATAIMSAITSLLLSVKLERYVAGTRDVILFMKNSVITIKSLESRVRWSGYVDCSLAISKMKAYYMAQSQRQDKLKVKPYESKDNDDLNLIV